MILLKMKKLSFFLKTKAIIIVLISKLILIKKDGSFLNDIIVIF